MRGVLFLRDDDKLKYKSSRDISKNSNQHKDSHVKDDADDLSPQRIGGHRPVHAQSRGELDANKKAEVSHGYVSLEFSLLPFFKIFSANLCKIPF